MSADQGIKTYVTETPEEIFEYIKSGTALIKARPEFGTYPFSLDLLKLLKESNPFRQNYYYIEDVEHYAFFILYESRMNIMTLGKSEWMMNVKTIGFPCSFSNSGYITDDLEFLLNYCKKLKGGKLILNVEKPVGIKGMGFGETLPTCVLKLRKEHTSADAFLKSLRSPYRRRIRLAEKRCAPLSVLHYNHFRNADEDKEKSASFDKKIYPLYQNTFNKSEYKLECLSLEFFEQCEGHRIVFLKEDRPVGFVLLFQDGGKLNFLFCGMDYDAFGEKKSRDVATGQTMALTNADLYFYMLIHIVEYAIESRCESIDFGQTSELTKLKFGARLEKRYFYAQHTNPFLNLFAILGKGLLEYRYRFPEFNVFRQEEE